MRLGNLEVRKRKSVVRFNLYRSSHPAIAIRADRVHGMYVARGFILFHWLFVGLERVGYKRYIVWNWGLKPLREPHYN